MVAGSNRDPLLVAVIGLAPGRNPNSDRAAPCRPLKCVGHNQRPSGRPGSLRPDVVATLAHLLGHHPDPYEEREDLAPEAQSQGRLQEGGDGQETQDGPGAPQ